MSRQLRMKFLALFVVSITTGIALEAGRKNLHAGRKLASIEAYRSLATKGKGQSTIRVSIQAPRALPDRENQEIELIGYVTISQPLDGGLEFEWSLPPNVRIVGGNIKDELFGVHTGQVVRLPLQITGFSKENSTQITLNARGDFSGIPLGSSALISSRPEDSFEYLAPVVVNEAEKLDRKKNGGVKSKNDISGLGKKMTSTADEAPSNLFNPEKVRH